MQAIPAIIITIGDELLIGQTIDTNSAWIAQQLNPLGILVKRRIAVGDEKEDILDALNEARKLSDIIIITGGLGPTSDDITKPLLCEYFGGKLVLNEQVLAHVQSIFAKRNRPMLQSNTNQALVPDVCEVLFNEVGTAPGMLFKQAGKLFISLPGVPFEMQHIMTNHVIDRIREAFQGPTITHRSLVTSGEGESFVAERLKTFEDNLPPSIKLAYLPKLNMVKLRLTGIDALEDDLNARFEELKDKLSDIVVGEGDIEIEDMIHQILIQTNKTISIAESCTGGHIAARITSMKGSSNYFKGGIVPYAVESKINVLGIDVNIIDRTTVVSEETAIAMALQCRKKFNTNYALSTTGYLEKGDHNNEVWIGLSSEKHSFAKKIITPYDREKNTILATNTALNLLRIFILEHN
jgi:nicotinamide-nucleotide amidase